jgi:hypothetical protein
MNAAAHDDTARLDGAQRPGTRSPRGAKMSAASRGSGGAVVESPAHAAPRLRAKAWAAASPGRVKANTRRPS